MKISYSFMCKGIKVTIVDEDWDWGIDGMAGRCGELAELAELADAPAHAPAHAGKGDQWDGPPSTGLALMAWCYQTGRSKKLFALGEKKQFPKRVKEWTPAQVTCAYKELIRVQPPHRSEPEPVPPVMEDDIPY